MIPLPDTNDINRIADWIELYVLSEDRGISKSKIISVLEGCSVSIDEETIDSAISELVRRLTLYGSVKPYEIKNNVISPKFNWEKYPEFTLCLYYSTFGVSKNVKGVPADKGTKLFEEITKVCIESHLNCKSFVFGFPSTDSFKTQLDKFALLIRENRYEDPNTTDKDRGVDIIAWKEFDEFRNNSVLFFIQFAAGKHWGEKKAVSIESYRSYFNFNYKAVISSLSITQIIAIEDWNNATNDYGIIIDRARLYRAITSDSYSMESSIKTKIKNWCKAKLN
ncbi:hypothetical protein BH10ACI1_BH10ACI1_30180 [soil metagenome]